MLRCMLAVDESIGALIEALREAGQLDDTLVVVSSDNGYYLGEHRLSGKSSAYEESIRIPMIFRHPRIGRGGSRIRELALNIDVAPTLLDAAGVEQMPPTMQGRSLLPLLRGEPPADWRRSFLYEYFHSPRMPSIPTMLAVRTSRYKYITYPRNPGEIDELYDLETDPGELRNLAHGGEPSPLRQSMLEELERLESETGLGDARRAG